MSTLRVTAERLTIHEHPNADALELAQVGLYRAVVVKGRYKTGDYAVYIPEQAVLPDDLIEELALRNYLAGSQKNRVHPVRLRGELSQGIVCNPAALDGIDLQSAELDGKDFAEMLGIEKWVPPIPVHMSGKVESTTTLLPWLEIEDIKRYPDIFSPDEIVVLTEKVHGTCSLLTWIAETGDVVVSSKGFAEDHLALVDEPGNLYWRTLRAHSVPEVAERIGRRFNADRVGIFGEVYGMRIQDLHYGANGESEKPGYAVFDVAVDVDGQVTWLSQDAMVYALDGEIPTVPRLYVGPYDVETVFRYASGREQVTGTEQNIREGVVIRPLVERESPALMAAGHVRARAIAKAVSPEYLTRKGGTEYA